MCVPFLPLSPIQSFPWCSDCVAECCDVLVKCSFCYGFSSFVFPLVPLFLGSESVALMQQEREEKLAQERNSLCSSLLDFRAREGLALAQSLGHLPAPCPLLLSQGLDARWGMAFLECPARV